ESPATPRALVLGDLMLDVYTTGHAERISAEAPVIVLRVREQKSLLGGAANVCHMLRGLHANVSCAGVIGADDAGRRVRGLLTGVGIDGSLLHEDDSRQTTVKERFLGASASRSPSQVLRVDRESREPVAHGIEDELLKGLCSRIVDHDVLMISDYAKGVCTPRLVQAAIRASRQAGVPVLVDPLCGKSYDLYRGATVLKPNRSEAEQASGITIRRPADACRAGRRLCEMLDLHYAVITLDRDGIVLVERDGAETVFPTAAHNVCDITGAGDMVLAVLGYCIASGVALTEAVQLANVAASLEVQRVGVAVITKDEIRHELLAMRRCPSHKIVTVEEAARLADMHRQRGEKTVFTNGCFDLLHVGHVAMLSEAAARGDVLFVGVNSDQSVRRLKGSQRPIIGEQERAEMLAAMSSVGYVVVFEEDTPHGLLRAIRPDVLVKGGTYRIEEVVGHEIVQSYGGTVCVTGVVDGVSTTNILESALNRARVRPQDRQAA
ncbi:MAG: D-glycero-beta-D-manno-heptose 1-phosphate adenylyltransferase, partial [Pirellulaceae bacterium]